MCFRALLGIRFANWEARRRQRKILERLRSGVLGVSLPLPLQPTPGQVFQGQTPPWLPAMVKRELSSGSSVHSRRAKSPTGISTVREYGLSSCSIQEPPPAAGALVVRFRL